MTTTIVFGIFALVVIGIVLAFAAVLDRRRGRQIERDLSSPEMRQGRPPLRRRRRP